MARLMVFFTTLFFLIVSACGTKSDAVIAHPLVPHMLLTIPTELRDAVTDPLITARMFYIVSPTEGAEFTNPDDVISGFQLTIDSSLKYSDSWLAVDGEFAHVDYPSIAENGGIVNIFYPYQKLPSGAHRLAFWVRFQNSPKYYYKGTYFFRR